MNHSAHGVRANCEDSDLISQGRSHAPLVAQRRAPSKPLTEEHIMNNDPLLVGVGSLFPNQNSSTAPTVWEEDTDQGAQQGLPSGSGPMLTLTKRSNSLAFLPNGALNPAPEPNPECLIVSNLRISPGVVQQLSAARLGSGMVGASAIGGTPPSGAIPGARGIGVLGVGAPGDGVRGLALGAAPAGHGVFGQTNSSNPSDAGVKGEAGLGGVGVKGESRRGSGIGVQGVGSSQAVRGDGGSFGVVGTGTATGVDGTGAFGVVGRGTVTGVDGRAAGAGNRGVVGIGGLAGVQGGSRTAPGSGIGVLGSPVRTSSAVASHSFRLQPDLMALC